jgi:hypothetical protein
MYHICPRKSQAQFGGRQRPNDKGENTLSASGSLKLALPVFCRLGGLDDDRGRTFAS